jgi:hypothetical protein
MTSLDDPLRPDDEPEQHDFTLHVDFVAGNEDQALLQAEQYLQALGILRTDIDSFQARVSARQDWSTSIGVFCNAPGPDARDCCVSRFGHDGWHHGVGPTDAWADDETSAP